MRKQSFSLLLGSLLVCSYVECFAHSLPKSEPPDRVRLEVHVYDHVRIPQTELEQAETMASSILSKAGVELIWAECSFGKAEQNEACKESASADALVLILVDHLEKINPWVSPSALGYSFLGQKGRHGSTAYIGVNRVKALCKGGVASEDAVLGLAMAHELGHLLLNSNYHPALGIMRTRWPGEELRNPVAHEFVFSRDEAKQLRAAVEERQRETGQVAQAH